MRSIFVLALISVACTDGADEGHPTAASPLARLIGTEAADVDGRARRLSAMDELMPPVSNDVIDALLGAMTDRSQQAFVLVADDSDLGFHVEENPFGGVDDRAEIRWTAIIALERVGAIEALPDLISALHDRHPVVRNHAARALFRFGSTTGLPILVANLEEKAFGNETANRILEEITAGDAGFSTDAGWTEKLEAIAKWKRMLAETPPRPPRDLPRKGEHPRLDRRVRFLVAMLGQHQFLFMEQARRNLGMLDGLAVEHIAAVIDDPELGASQQLRAYAVEALENNSSPTAGPLLVNLLADDAAPVRARAALAVGRRLDVGAAARVATMLADVDEGVIAAAARALALIGGDGELTALRGVAGDEGRDLRTRRLARGALACLGDREAARAVLEALVGDDVDARIDLHGLLSQRFEDLGAWDPSRPLAEQTDVERTLRLRLGLGPR